MFDIGGKTIEISKKGKSEWADGYETCALGFIITAALVKGLYWVLNHVTIKKGNNATTNSEGEES